MEESEITLDEALKLSTEELHLAIGDSLARTMSGAIPSGPKQKRSISSAWMAGMKEALCEKICPNENIRMLFVDNVGERELAAAIIDLISSVVIGISPVLVSCLLVRQGLIHLCKERWPSNNN